MDYIFRIADEMINKTTIIYDFKFQQFIKKLQKKAIYGWNFSNSLSFDFNDFHNWIQDYTQENKQSINFSGNITSKPNLYVINICLLIDIDKYSSFEKIIIRELPRVNFANTNTSGRIRCACGKEISPEYTYHMSSFDYLNNPIIIQLGMVCIEKIGITQKELKRIKKEKIEKDNKQTEIADRNKKIVIRQLFNQIIKRKNQIEEVEKNKRKMNEQFKTYRRCSSCKKFNILRIEKGWKKVCINCHINTKSFCSLGVSYFKGRDLKR